MEFQSENSPKAADNNERDTIYYVVERVGEMNKEHKETLEKHLNNLGLSLDIVLSKNYLEGFQAATQVEIKKKILGLVGDMHMHREMDFFTSLEKEESRRIREKSAEELAKYLSSLN